MISLFCLAICNAGYSAATSFGLAARNHRSLSPPLSFSSSSHFLSFSKPNFRVGDPQSPFSISSAFILLFVSLPFFLKTKLSGWRPSIAFSISSSFILFFVSLPFFLKTKFNFEHATRCRIRVGQVALVVWRGSEEPHVER